MPPQILGLINKIHLLGVYVNKSSDSWCNSFTVHCRLVNNSRNIRTTVWSFTQPHILRTSKLCYEYFKDLLTVV